MTFSWETIAANLESPIASGIYALVAALLLIVTASQFQKLGTLDVKRVGIPLGILATIRVVEIAVFWGSLGWESSYPTINASY